LAYSDGAIVSASPSFQRMNVTARRTALWRFTQIVNIRWRMSAARASACPPLGGEYHALRFATRWGRCARDARKPVVA